MDFHKSDVLVNYANAQHAHQPGQIADAEYVPTEVGRDDEEGDDE